MLAYVTHESAGGDRNLCFAHYVPGRLFGDCWMDLKMDQMIDTRDTAFVAWQWPILYVAKVPFPEELYG